MLGSAWLLKLSAIGHVTLTSDLAFQLLLNAAGKQLCAVGDLVPSAIRMVGPLSFRIDDADRDEAGSMESKSGRSPGGRSGGPLRLGCALRFRDPSRERIEEHRRHVRQHPAAAVSEVEGWRSIFLNPHRRRAVEAHMRLRKTIGLKSSSTRRGAELPATSSRRCDAVGDRQRVDESSQTGPKSVGQDFQVE